MTNNKIKENPYYHIIVNVTFVLFLITLSVLLVRENAPQAYKMDIQAIDFDNIGPKRLRAQGHDLHWRFKKVSQKYDPLITQIANAYGVDSKLIRAIVMTESGYRPHVVSKRGALGLMQLMPETARSMGVKNAFNPRENITGGVKYFQWLLKEFDQDKLLALAAYNAGIGKVRMHHNKVPPYPETRRFIRRVYHYYTSL